MSDKYIDEILPTLQENSKTVRNTYISYLAVAAFIWITVESVTHRQLLLPAERLTLPLIGVKLPIIGFFWVAPFLLLLFHLYFALHVLQFARLLTKPSGGAAVDPYAPWKDRIYGSLFSWMFLAPVGKQPFNMQLVHILVFISFWMIVPIVLIRTQWIFLPYHYDVLTGFHRILFTLAVLLHGYFLSEIHRLRYGPFGAYFFKILKEFLNLRGFFKNWNSTENFYYFVALALLVFIIPNVFIFSWTLLTIPQTQEDNEAAFSVWQEPIAQVFKSFNEYSKNDFNEEGKLIISRAIERSLNLREQKLALAPSEEVKAALVNSDKKKIDFYDSLDLQRRDLRFANFFKADLKKADLGNAQLQGAFLYEAQLQGAKLEDAQLQGANLRRAQIQGADLGKAQIQGADLGEAQLQGADLFQAQLQGSNLYEAQLQGANLLGAELQGAVLRRAELQSAYFLVAQLQGADLRYAQLQGANLSYAQLQGANLSYAQLQGADFGEAKTEALSFIDKELEKWAEEIPETHDQKKRFTKKMLQLRKGKRKAVLPDYVGPFLIRHSGQEVFKGFDSVDKDDQWRDLQKEIWQPLLCKFPVLQKTLREYLKYPFQSKQELEAAIQSCDAKN